MHVLHLIVSSTGRIAPGCFAAAVVAVYILGLAAQLLTAPAVLSKLGLWPFGLAQTLLTWIWFALHAKRLRDAGRGIALAQGIAAIHVLAVVLLILLAGFLLDEGAAAGNATPVSLGVLRQLFSLSRGVSDALTFLGFTACASLMLAPVFSLWLGLQPSHAAQKP